jgi:riboflavin kinase/FMN adenylyltransferase
MSLRVIEWLFLLEGANREFSRLKSVSEGLAMAIGVFDGVHLGHQALIERIVGRGPNPTIVTFRENPKKVLSRIQKAETPSPYKGDLYSLKQKMEIFDSLGVKFLVLIDFSEEFSKLKGREFLDILGNKGKMAFLAIGNNFRCGFRQDTGADLARRINEEKGIPTELIPPVYLKAADGEPVSSSFIRSAVLAGDLKLASGLLGRNFALDLSDAKCECVEPGYVYDLCSVDRIVPAAGYYSVLMFPGGISGQAYTEDGKIFLPMEAESVEFIRSE